MGAGAVRVVAAAAVAALGLGLFPAASAGAGTQGAAGRGAGPRPAAQAATGTTTGAPAGAAAVPLPGHWSLDGSTLTWTSPTRLPMGGARPEMRLGKDTLGPAVQDGDVLRLRLTPAQLAAAAADPGGLAVVAAGRRLDAPAAAGTDDGTGGADGGAGDAVAGLAVGARPPLTADPGRTGPWRIRAATYTLPARRLAGLAVPVEVQGLVVGPAGAGASRLPVVLLLHGRHSTCYLPGRDQTSGEWPCPSGWAAIPSYRGYVQTQRLLASRGFLTVSVAANGINGQDGGLDDAGASARSALVRLHLRLLRTWAAGGRAPVLPDLLARADLGRVVLVGHSRGGEGVNRAALDSRTADPWRIRGQLLLAPTAFGRQPSPATPTAVVLPYCDGDVSDLQGQQYVDGARDVSDDRALRAAVLVLGANHNFFNSEWTPGTAQAPAEDDWYDQSDPACGTGSPAAGLRAPAGTSASADAAAPAGRGLRLSAAEQRAVGATYVAAAAEVFARGAARYRALLDGSAVRAASAGPARVYVAALGGGAAVALRPSDADRLGATAGARAAVCLAWTPTEVPGPCAGSTLAVTPHWLNPDSVPGAPAPRALEVTWTRARATAAVRPASPLDLSGADALQLRVALPARQAALRVSVRLVDAAGRTAVLGTVALAGLPGAGSVGKVWARSVRLPLRGGIDLRRVVAVQLRGVSRAGRLWLLDASGWDAGRWGGPSVAVPRADVGRMRVVEGSGATGTRTVAVPVRLAGAVHPPARLWVQVRDPESDTQPEPFAVDLATGETGFSVPVTFRADGGDDEDTRVFAVSVRGQRGVVARQFVGGVTVVDDDPPSRITAVQADVSARPGRPLTWVLVLDRPSHRTVSATWLAEAVPAGQTELRTDGVPALALAAFGVDPPPDPPEALSRTTFQAGVQFDTGQTQATITLPTTARAAGRAVSLVARFGDPAPRLTGAVAAS